MKRAIKKKKNSSKFSQPQPRRAEMCRPLSKIMIIIFIDYNYGSHYSNMRPPTPYKYTQPFNEKIVRLVSGKIYIFGIL